MALCVDINSTDGPTVPYHFSGVESGDDCAAAASRGKSGIHAVRYRTNRGSPEQIGTTMRLALHSGDGSARLQSILNRRQVSCRRDFLNLRRIARRALRFASFERSVDLNGMLLNVLVQFETRIHIRDRKPTDMAWSNRELLHLFQWRFNSNFICMCGRYVIGERYAPLLGYESDFKLFQFGLEGRF